MKKQLLSTGRQYISKGFPIFPVNLWWDQEKQKWMKQPLIKKWEQQSVPTEEDLRKWSNISKFNAWGLVTGKKSGVVVLDIDNPDLIKEFNLPHTPRVRSISGGYHYYLEYPKDAEVKSHKGILPKVDIRADKGFIVIPPSAADQEHAYTWEVSLDAAVLASIPTWLMDLLEVTQSPEYIQNNFDSDKPIEPGERHKTALQAIGYFSLKYRDEDLEKIWQRLNDWMKSKFTIQFGQEEMTWLKKSFDQYAPRNITNTSGSSSSETVSSRVIKLIIDDKFDLFKTEDKTTYIGLPDKPLTVLPTDSEEFFEVVSLSYYNEFGIPLMKDALKRVMPTIRALINKQGEKIELFNRVAARGGIFFDLFEDDVFVRVDIEGVSLVGANVIKEAGLRFVRYPHQRKQVKPDLSASIQDAYRLFDFLAIKDEEQQKLLLCHLAACLVPNIARCMLVLHGSRGSAKSTTLKFVRSLIDPAKPMLVRIPEKDNDLQIFLEKSYFCCFDNVSGISKQVSDSLAMMITGGGTISRKLYSDKEIVTTDLKSCLALNGINLAIREADLLERSLIIETKRLTEVKSEEEITNEFEEAKPIIFGGLLALLSASIKSVISGEAAGYIPTSFRMADYYRFASGAAWGLGISDHEFDAMFQRNVNRQNEAAIESSPLAQVVVDYMADKAVPVEMRSSELYTSLTERAKEMGVDKGMPRGAHMLWKRLNPLRIDLEAVGIVVERVDRNDASYIRVENKKVAVAAEEAANNF
ncbi:MAG: bifunctional DNA primase/polymerase [Pseudomonadales bacterium]|nr:bifunctional DNA primase/polymerase [Pseudomonadales bacterium]